MAGGRSLLLGAMTLTLMSVPAARAGGTVGVETGASTLEPSTGRVSIPVFLAFEEREGLAAMQFRIVSADRLLRIVSATRGSDLPSSWGFAANTVPGVGADTTIVVMWSLSVIPLSPGRYDEVAMLEVLWLGQTMELPPGTFEVSGVVAALGDGFASRAEIRGGTNGQSIALIPGEIVLSQNYPNPFNPRTTIRYSLPDAGHARVSVCDAAGRSVATLVDGWHERGTYSLHFDGGTAASGAYYYTLAVSDARLTRRMVLVR